MKIRNRPKRIQFFYFLLMFVSGGILFYIKTLADDEQNIWVMLLLLIVVMYSLMKSTRNWAYDNPKKTEDETEKIVYKDVDIPSLEEMGQKKEIEEKD